MAQTFIIKQHDTKQSFHYAPTIDGVAIPPGDLAGCTLSFLMKDDATPPLKSIKQDAVINPDGTFSYDPVAADVDTTGKFKQEWELVYPSTKILTFPNNGYNVVKILADLG